VSHYGAALTGESVDRLGPKRRVSDRIWRPVGLSMRTQWLYRLQHRDRERSIGAMPASGTAFPKEGRFERAGVRAVSNSRFALSTRFAQASEPEVRTFAQSKLSQVPVGVLRR
jgi:hypothetical protein